MNIEVVPNLHLQKEPEASSFVLRAIERLSEINAEGILEEELKKNQQILQKAGEFKVGIIVADDMVPSAVTREQIELQRMMDPDPDLKQGCLSLLWWTSDEVTEENVRTLLAEQLFKFVKTYDGKLVRTLSELVNLEAQTLRYSKITTDKKRQIWFSDFAKYMLSADRATMISCFYGDEAARKIGKSPLGFPKNAGRIYAGWMA